MITDIYTLLDMMGIEYDYVPDKSEIKVVCPFHHGEVNFCINLIKEVYYCQSCHETGNLTKFIADKYNISWHEARKLMLKKGAINSEKNEIFEHKEVEDLSPHPPFNKELPEGLFLESKYRRISPETMKYFGVYCCIKGYYTNSLIIPVHNELGELVGFQARTLGTPFSIRSKYLFEEVQVKRIIYNYNRIKWLANFKVLYVVEGMISVMNFYEHGIPNVVALLGSHWGEKKASLLRNHKLILCLDRDEAGDNISPVIRETKNIEVIKEIKLPIGLEFDEIGKKEFDKYIRG